VDNTPPPRSAPAAAPVVEAAPPTTPSVDVMGQSYTTYRNAELEIEYATTGVRDTPAQKGDRVEGRELKAQSILGVSTMIKANPRMNAEVLHLGGPSKPDFIPRTADGVDYDFVHETNYDTFPLTPKQINDHMYGRPYSFTLRPWFYLNPRGQTVNPANIARLQQYLNSGSGQ
jgi:hypothetical protein